MKYRIRVENIRFEQKLRIFAPNLDKTINVKPGEFEFELPDEYDYIYNNPDNKIPYNLCVNCLGKLYRPVPEKIK